MAIDIKQTIKIDEQYKAIIMMIALFLRALSDRLCILAGQQITTTSNPTPYTGPTYGKMANTTRAILSGKILHEKGFTGTTGWLYVNIAGLIDRHKNKLEISLHDLNIETGISEQAIITHTKFLECLGLLTVDRESAGPKSNKINIYSLAGEGAKTTLFNGTQKNITTKKQPSKILTTPANNFDGKDSLQTNTNIPAVAAVKNVSTKSEKIVFSPQQQAAINALNSIKITKKVARELVISQGDDLERLFATIKCSNGSGINNPAGFVRAEMENNKQDLSWDIVKSNYESLDSFIASYLPKSKDDYNHDVPDKPEHDPPMYDHPAGPELPPLPDVDPQVKDQWRIAYGQLELQFDRATFDTWLRNAQVIGCEDGVFVIAVRDKYVRDMLQHRLYRNVRRVLSDVRGKTTEMSFVVKKFASETQAIDDEPLHMRLAREV